MVLSYQESLSSHFVYLLEIKLAYRQEALANGGNFSAKTTKMKRQPFVEKQT